MAESLDLLLGLLLPGKRDKHLSRAFPEVAKRHPRALLEACKALGVRSINVPYLDRFTIDLDPSGGSISEDVLADGSYQVQTTFAIPDAIVDGNPLFVNVGANIGTTCLNAAHRGFRSFLAFEPTRRNFALLQKNVAANGLDAELHLAGLGREAGTALIHLHPTSTGRHSIKKDFAQGGEEEITIRTLDSFNLQTPFFLWVDTEGYELEVLEGAARSLREHCVGVCIELSPVISGAADALAALEVLRNQFDVFLSDQGVPQDPDRLAQAIRSGELRQMDLVCLRGEAPAGDA